MKADSRALTLGFFIPTFFSTYQTGTHDMNPVGDFKCVSYLRSEDAGFFVVGKNSKYKTFSELIADAKSRPGQITLGLSIGSRTHFQVESFAQIAGVKFKYVSADHAADQVTALLGGHIELTYLNAANTEQYVATGDMRALAAMGEAVSKNPEILAIPTTEKLGYEKIKANLDFFIVASNNVDEATCRLINECMKEAVKDPTVINRLENIGFRLTGCEYEEGLNAYQETYNTYDSVAEALGVKAKR
jgi:tripartite-type tricarboxylate transporter receptor subunit TctC